MNGQRLKQKLYRHEQLSSPRNRDDPKGKRAAKRDIIAAAGMGLLDRRTGSNQQRKRNSNQIGAPRAETIRIPEGNEADAE